MIEELMEVHQGSRSKDLVFQTKREEFNAEFARLQEQDKITEGANQAITGNIGDFQKLK